MDWGLSKLRFENPSLDDNGETAVRGALPLATGALAVLLNTYITAKSKDLTIYLIGLASVGLILITYLKALTSRRDTLQLFISDLCISLGAVGLSVMLSGSALTGYNEHGKRVLQVLVSSVPIFLYGILGYYTTIHSSQNY